jgi:hypothetical protein
MPGSPILSHQDSLSYAWQSNSVASGQITSYAWPSNFVASGQSKLRLAVQFCGIRTVPDMPGSQIYGSNVQYKPYGLHGSPSLGQPGLQ